MSKPDYLKSNDYVEKLYEIIAADSKTRETYNIIHMADMHVDMDYEPGSDAFCGEPLCCRAINGYPQEADKKAGYYGSHGSCDVPF